MPPDVFLLLASSGISLVASLLFFVSDDRPILEREAAPEDLEPLVDFCLPPQRPPPLPPGRSVGFDVSTPQVAATLTLKPRGDEWELQLTCTPRGDAPLVQVDGPDVGGQVTDLRWHQRAGAVRSTQKQWRIKPGRA